MAGVEGEVVQNSSNLLLTFTKVRNETGKNNDVFNQAQKAILDMGVAMNNGSTEGLDLSAASIQVGKALNDPIQGVTALTRVGVQFTEQQKEQIKTLVESGDTLGAQKIILKELETQFGGSAAAAGKNLPPMERLQLTFANLAESVGTLLLPFVDKFSKGLENLANKFSNLSPEGQKFAVIFGGIAAAVGPVLIVVGKLIQSFGLIKTALQALSFNPWVIGITLAAGALVLLWKNSETFRNIVTAAFNAVKDVVSGVFAFIETVITTFAGRWNDPDIVSDGWVGKIEAVVVFVRAAFDSLMAWWNGIWPQFSEAFSHTWNVIQGIFEVAISVITTLWRVWGDDLMTILKAVWTIISGIVEGAINVVKGIIQTVLAIINGDWSRAWEGIKMIFSGVWTAIKAIVEGALGIIKGVIGGAWDAVRTITSNAWEGVKSAVANAIGNLLGEVRAIPGKITSALGNLGSLLWSAGKDIVQGMINGVKSMGTTLVNAIVNLIPGPVRGVVKKALGIGSPSKVFKGFGQNIMEGLVIGLQDRSNNLNQQMARIANQVSLGGIPSLSVSGTATNQRALTPVAQTAAPIYEVSVTLPDRAVKLSLDSADPMSLKRFIEQLAELLQRREASFA
jgi:phage-related protein